MLKNRGFDGLPSDDLDRAINWAYYEIARKATWFWEDSYIDAAFSAGDSFVKVSDIGNLRELKAVYSVSTSQERKLMRMDEAAWENNWLPLDLSSASYRAEPDHYFYAHENIYILPPPASARTFRIYYYAMVKPLVAESDKPITPVDMDEAILLGALKRCHVEANEQNQADRRDRDLQAVVSDMFTDETNKDGEFQERVEPDDTWL